MPTVNSNEITHTFNRPPDLLFGVDNITIDIPGDGFFTNAVVITSEAKQGSAQVFGLPMIGSMGRQTVAVTWELALVPGSYIKYHLSVEYKVFETGYGGVILFEHRDFYGASLRVDNSLGTLVPSGFNDKASSIVVLNGKWIFYKDINFSSPYTTGGNVAIMLERGMYPWVNDKGILNDDISSLRAIRS